MTNRFIVFEGGEGAGKSTAIKKLFDELTDKGESVILTREPGGSPKAEEIRTLLLSRRPHDNFDWDTQLLLHYAARIEHITSLVIPALQAGKTVLCDRFELSSFQYQITAGEASLGLFRDLHSHVNRLLKTAKVPTPEYVVFKLEPKIGLERVRQAKLANKDTSPDVFDDADISFHQNLQAGVTSGLRELYVEESKQYFIDASQAPDEVFEAVQKALQM